MNVRLETAQSVLAPKGSVDVVVDVKEVPRWYLKTGTEVGAGEGGAYVTANVRNVFGGAESLAVQFSTGTKTRLAFEVNFPFYPVLESPLDLPTWIIVADIGSFVIDNFYCSQHSEPLFSPRHFTPSLFPLFLLSTLR